MPISVPIGEFSRLTHLTVKTLRHYHDLGLLVPYSIDDRSGYRRYAVDQVSDALLIGRLRALDMPLPEVRRAVAAATSAERDGVIAEHLDRMERSLDRTRAIVGSLRDLLAAPAVLTVDYRSIPELSAVAITERVERADIEAWCSTTFGTLYTGLFAAGGAPVGPGSALYGEEFFTEAVGTVTAFVPVNPTFGTVTIPGGRYAVALHAGPFTAFDQTYAALGSHVATHGSAATGPIREIYHRSPPDTDDENQFRTEVCWPVAA